MGANLQDNWEEYEPDDPEPAPVVEEPGNALALLFASALMVVLVVSGLVLFAEFLIRSAGG